MGRRRAKKRKTPVWILRSWRTIPSLGKVGDRITLHITDVAFGGEGVGRHEGFVVFVPFVITGETVLAEIEERFIDNTPAHAWSKSSIRLLLVSNPSVHNIRFAVAASISTWLTTSSWSSSISRSAICSSALEASARIGSSTGCAAAPHPMRIATASWCELNSTGKPVR